MHKKDLIVIRIEPDLKAEVVDYAKRNSVSVSSIVRRFLVRLIEAEENSKSDVEQI